MSNKLICSTTQVVLDLYFSSCFFSFHTISPVSTITNGFKYNNKLSIDSKVWKCEIVTPQGSYFCEGIRRRDF